MPIKWIAVVTRVDARVFSEKTFRPLAQFKNELGREKNRAMTTDKPGRAPGKFVSRTGIHNLGNEKSPHEDAAIVFAKKLNEFFKKNLKMKHFAELLIVAEPKMMGRLKSQMDPNLSKCTEWLGKDLGKYSPTDLRKVIAATQTTADVLF
jgi:protein required for attachment to host cells